MDSLLEKYKKELRNKIELKMIPNKTEEQILNQFFRYYDLEGNGYCTLQQFIQTHERLGVVLPKLNDIEKIFEMFAKDNKINYKKYSKEIFSENENNYNNYNKNLNNDFSEILDYRLKETNQDDILYKFIKNLKIVDFNKTKRLSIDDFIKVINELKLNVNSTEIQSLFNNYDFFSNGLVFYMNIINEILNKKWNENRENLSINLFNKLNNNNNGKELNLNDIKNSLSDPYLLKKIDEFININEDYNNKIFTIENFKQLIKYISYNIDSDNELKEILFEMGEKKIINENNNNNNNNNLNNKFNDLNLPENKMRMYLQKYGRKTLFNFIKHFKYYDNETGYITKYDLLKVLKDFNIPLSINDIENLFNTYSEDQKKTLINYIKFFNYLTQTNNVRVDMMNNALDKIIMDANNLRRPVDLTFLKEIYNSKNNYFIQDETQNRIDFDECLELFHFIYKGFKVNRFSEEEFLEFYHFISYLIDNDDDFVKLLENEWNLKDFNPNYNNNNNADVYNNQKMNNFNPNEQNNFNKNDLQENNNNLNNNNYDLNNNNFNNNNNNFNNNNDYQNKFNNPAENEFYEKNIQSNPKTNYLRQQQQQNNENIKNPLENLEKKLKNRGIRGLLYLHRQFVLSCPDIMHITLQKFISVLEGQHILLNDLEYQNLFNLFMNEEGYLNFNAFIRSFKKELNDKKLNCVEEIYKSLDKNDDEQIPLNYLKKIYNPKNHPNVLNGKMNEDEKAIEFIDCFEINFDLLNQDGSNQNEIINFEIFANFYEYVAFVYEKDEEFENILNKTWN